MLSDSSYAGVPPWLPFSLDDWLTYVSTIHSETIDLSLERVQNVAKKLNIYSTSFDIPVFTVAGTNGKGSCVCFLQTILNIAGYRVGTYTSPHLHYYNERIAINGIPLDDAQIITAFVRIEQARGNCPLTYFEFGTLAALDIFRQAELDAIVLEVGLGGRLDAVNIIDADIAIISSIDLDHTEWLGTTREQIAREKAGIFRPHRPAICGDPDPPDSLLECAAKLQTPLFVRQRDFNDEIPLPFYLDIQNASTVSQALKLLQDRLPVPESAIQQGLRQAKLPGRYDRRRLVNGCRMILDVAHNPHAARLLAKKISYENNLGKIVAVVGILADKDIAGILNPLCPWVSAWLVVDLDVPRGAKAAMLAPHLSQLTNNPVEQFASVEEAYRVAVSRLKPEDILLGYGSFRTVEQLLTVSGMGF